MKKSLLFIPYLIALLASCSPFDYNVHSAIDEGDFGTANNLIKSIDDSENKALLKKRLIRKFLTVKADSIKQWREYEALNFGSNTGEELHQKGKKLVERAQEINNLFKKEDFRLEIHLDAWEYQYEGICTYNLVMVDEEDEFIEEYGYFIEDLKYLPNLLISPKKSDNEIAQIFIQIVLQSE